MPGDTNGLMDIFLHDRDADGDGIFDEAGGVCTERVNLGLSDRPGVPVVVRPLGGASSDPVISGNGRYVAYPVGGHQPARRRRHQRQKPTCSCSTGRGA